VVPSSRDELDVGGRGSLSVRLVVFGFGGPFFATGGLAEPLRLENRPRSCQAIQVEAGGGTPTRVEPRLTTP